jgi:hypothetical protein
MILSVNQPYFCPFAGFFYKLQMCDVLVILDSVQFPQGTTWITRNRFKNDQGVLWITVPVWKKGLGLQTISDVRICHEGRWQKKHMESLKSAYMHAPYFAEHQELFESIFSEQFKQILDVNLRAIEHAREYLEIETRIVLLSKLGIDAKGSRLLVDICRALNADQFLAQSGAAKYLDQDVFAAAGIEVLYLKYPEWIYPQLWGNFIANLSVFDLIFNCGRRARDILFAGDSPAKRLHAPG